MAYKFVVIISLAASIALITLNHLGTFRLCSGNYSCAHTLASLISSSVIFFAVALISPLFLMLKSNSSDVWTRFTLFWIPVSILTAYFTPETHNLIQTGPGVTGIVLTLTYVVISLGIITWGALFTRK
jgi:hypothetical protein